MIGKQASLKFEKNKTTLKYLLYLPERYEERKSDWPLLIFLHGAGERGNRLKKVKSHGPPKLVEAGKKFPFILASPQCPKGQQWDINLLDLWLEELISHWRIDRSRIYLTGLSMGGYGCWTWAMKFPHRFAAIAPICGWGDVRQVEALKEIPVWAFHGAKDPVVPVEKSQEMVKRLKKIGGNVQLTIYPDLGHDSWSETYDNPKLYRWLLHQRRKKYK